MEVAPVKFLPWDPDLPETDELVVIRSLATADVCSLCEFQDFPKHFLHF